MIKIKFKFWFYNHYWWLLPFLFILISIYIIYVRQNLDFKLLVTFLGTLLSLFYFIQKQRLEEMKLFREIFAECNSRYDQLNEKLNSIIDNPSNTPLNREQIATLMDYFNLCGEEYLYYIQGYLFPEVWKAWYNGMQYFLANQLIAAVWSKEKKADSYYGLPL